MARLVRKLLSTKVNCFTLTRSSFSNRHKGTFLFYDRKTLHCDKFLVNKTNRRTEFQFYWYYDSTCFGKPFCPSSGVLSRTSALVHFMQLWWSLLPVCWLFATRSRMLLVANSHQTGSNDHHNCIKCTNADVRLRTPDDGQKGFPKHVES